MEDKRSYDGNYANEHRKLGCYSTCFRNNLKSKRQTKELEMSCCRNSTVITMNGSDSLDYHIDNTHLYCLRLFLIYVLLYFILYQLKFQPWKNF